MHAVCLRDLHARAATDTSSPHNAAALARNAAARLSAHAAAAAQPAAGAAPDQAQPLAPTQAAGLARLLAALPWAHLARLHGLADGGDLRGARAGVRWLPGDPGDPALRAACQHLMRRLLCQARPCRAARPSQSNNLRGRMS